MRRHKLMLLCRFFGRGISNELYFIELVHTQQTACVLTMRARFPAETRRIRRKPPRDLRAVKNLISMKVRNRHFRCGDEKQSLIAQGIHVFFELWKLSSASHGCAVYNHRHPDFLITML